MCFTLVRIFQFPPTPFLSSSRQCLISSPQGSSIAEIVSAYPTNGGLYSASAYLVPRQYKASVGWVVGWLNLLGQVAGVASTEFGLSGMILSAVTIATDGEFVATPGQTVGLFIGLLCIHGTLNVSPCSPL